MPGFAEAGVQLIETEVPDIGDLLEMSAFPIALYEVERDLPAYLEEFDTGVNFAELSSCRCQPRCTRRVWRCDRRGQDY